MAVVWYILIHTSLGLIGYRVFTFDNEGGLLAALAAAVVQLWPTWELHRLARPRFEAALAQTESVKTGERMKRDYWWRLARVYMLRIAVFSLLTLFIAALARG